MMSLDTFRAAWRRLINAASMDGRLQVAQPWMLALGPVVLLCAFVVPYRWLFFVAYVYILLVVGSYVWVRTLATRVTLRRQQQSEWAQVGDTLVEQWELTNDARVPLLWLEIEDQSTLPEYSARRVLSTGQNAREHWQTSAICKQRGVYSLGPLTLRLSDPLGLFRCQWRDSAAHQVVIYPPLVRLPPLIIPRGQRGGLAQADLLQQHVTPSVGSLREYVPGDVPSRIHWPTVARRDKLMVKEFDQERAGALWIALDLYAASYAAHDHLSATEQHYIPASESEIYSSASVTRKRSAVEHSSTTNRESSPLELAVVLACSLAAQALSEGRAVGLMADDGRPRLLTPARGPRQLWRILSELVDAQATGVLPLEHMLQQGNATHGSAGASLAVVTPDIRGGWLPGVASYQRGKFGGALALLVAAQADQAAPLIARLAAAGILAHAFELGTPLPLLTPPKTETSTRVSPLGRIVQG